MLIWIGKDSRSCGSIVEGSVVPPYYDTGPIDAGPQLDGHFRRHGLQRRSSVNFSVAKGSEGQYAYPPVAQAPGGVKRGR